tara:strand:- start:4669 stop:5796 length:1128 start_codon:yes stop_codon:yes gene_type:complete
MELKKSLLYNKYLASNAKLVDFAGWEMPISFDGLINEHIAVRDSVGFFDISHMGVISITGVNPKEIIQKFFPTNLFSIAEGQGCYTLLLNDDGGIIDDLIVYDLGIQEEDTSEILLIVNASRYDTDLIWLKNNLQKDNIQISNAKRGKALIAIQGRDSFKYFEEWGKESIKHLSGFGCEKKIFNNFKDYGEIFLSKTGYTGEDGLEVLLSEELAIHLWDFLLSKKIKPCGLGARDTLRLEAGLHLYGQELNENINPYEAGLGWLINLESNHEFFGREKLEKISNKDIKKKLVGIVVNGKGIARQGCEVIKDNKKIGEVTSGSWSPTLKKPIALAYLESEYSNIGEEVDLTIRDKTLRGIVSKRAFYKKDFPKITF